MSLLTLTRLILPATSNTRNFTFSALRRTDSTPPTLSEGEQAIHTKLTATLAPSQLFVQDISGGCGSFYAITVTSSAFKGLSIVKQHRLVTETLKQEIEGIHGLQIKTIPQ